MGEQDQKSNQNLKNMKRKGGGRITNRGRVLDEDAIPELKNLIGDAPYGQDLTIEYLHLIQDHYGYLPQRLLHGLASLLRLSMAAIWEVASFYHHFDLTQYPSGQAPTARLRICTSVSCHLYDSQALLEDVKKICGDHIKVEAAPCMGLCDQAPAAMLGKNPMGKVNPQLLKDATDQMAVTPALPPYQSLGDYEAEGGFDSLTALVNGDTRAETIVEILSDSGLRGLGGAGFPTGRKWDLVRNAAGTKLMAVNADEGEPGTFKDRHYLSQKPFQFLEGVLIAAKIVEAEAVYIYLRDEYPQLHDVLRMAIAEMTAKPALSGHTKLILRRGAGAYICGEESAMIESIEGKRGLPRHRPPYVAQKGIFNQPTLVNNVETLYWVPHILKEGAKSFANQGINGAKGLRSYSVSGRVKNPGVKLTPAGITVQALIDEYCGGMEQGHEFAAYLPGGASGGILPASLNQLPLEFGALEEYGCFVGSHAVVIFSTQDDLKEIVKNLTHFFADESCGQCTPCRAGCDKSLSLMNDNQWDEAMLGDIGQWMSDASICGLGQAASNPAKSYFKYFKDAV
ncbi:MAG: NAD(P)H-dependent oxidoreductase subunit E [Alphaproteobacteria bacterium]